MCSLNKNRIVEFIIRAPVDHSVCPLVRRLRFVSRVHAPDWEAVAGR